ncbi:MAG: hypothetical protein Kow002_21030 [Anaerolineales bacterium]
MKDNLPKFMYVMLGLFVLLIIGFVSLMAIFSCGFSANCVRGQPYVVRTPLAVPPAADLPEQDFTYQVEDAAPTKAASEPCRVTAADLMAAWVSSGYPESVAFAFTDADGKKCEATFADDVQKLFDEADLWYEGALACSSCHSADLEVASAKLDLSSYEGMLNGSQRVIDEEAGTVVGDIFGGGNWEESLLYAALFLGTDTPLGHPTTPPVDGPVIFAGHTVE